MTNNAYTFLIGGTAQALFSIRILVQWIKSEKAKKVLAPAIFWRLSLAASLLFFIYGYLRNDFVIMLGQGITYFIYIRNMQLQYIWKKLNPQLRFFLYIFPIFILYYFFRNNSKFFEQLFTNEQIPETLLIWGTIGQLTFTFRFVYQWLYSEKSKESKLPLGFWLMSITGSIMLIIYSVIRKDPVLFTGQFLGFFMYIRNLYIILLK